MASIEQQAKKMLDPGHLDSVVENILCGLGAEELSSDLINRVVVHLKKKQEWDLLVHVTGILRQKGYSSASILSFHLLGLRGMDRLEEALELVRGDEASDHGILLQWTAILCEIGDFAGVIRKLGPMEPGLKTTPGDLLALLAWAHLYSSGEANARKAAEIYRRLRDSSALECVPGAKTLEIAHPAAYEGAQRFRRDMRKLVYYWHKRGYAAALERLPGRNEESQAEWQSLLDEVEPEIQPLDADPMMLRLAAQAYYHLKQHEKALETFKRTIDTSVNLHRTQFEFALSLWSAVGARTALNQFKRAITDLSHISPLKRLGMLHITLFDLAQVVLTTTMKHSVRGTGTICEHLQKEMTLAASEVRPSLQDLVKGIVSTANGIIEQITPLLSAQGYTGNFEVEELGRGSSRVIGILDRPRSAFCGLVEPVFERTDKPGRRFIVGVTEPNKQSQAKEPEVKAVSLDEHIIRLTGVNVASPAMRIVYFSDDALAVMAKVGVPLPQPASDKWHALPLELPGVFAAVVGSEGRDLLDSVSRRVASFLVKSQFRSERIGIKASELCLAAAQKEDSVYVAALCYALTHGASNIRSVREDLSHYTLPSESQLTEFAKRFAQIAECINRADSGRSSSSIREKLSSEIVGRANEIGGLKAATDRRLHAEWAASEIRAILPEDEESIEKETQIAHKLIGGTMVYLDDPFETLLLARDPAFFCSTRSGDFSRPALDTLAFFKASDPKGLTHVASGTFAQRARSIRR